MSCPFPCIRSSRHRRMYDHQHLLCLAWLLKISYCCSFQTPVRSSGPSPLLCLALCLVYLVMPIFNQFQRRRSPSCQCSMGHTQRGPFYHSCILLANDRETLSRDTYPIVLPQRCAFRTNRGIPLRNLCHCNLIVLLDRVASCRCSHKVELLTVFDHPWYERRRRWLLLRRLRGRLSDNTDTHVVAH